MVKLELLSERGTYSRVMSQIDQDSFKRFADQIVPLVERSTMALDTFRIRLFRALDKVLGEKSVSDEVGDYPNAGSIVKTGRKVPVRRLEAIGLVLKNCEESLEVLGFVGRDYTDHGQYFADIDREILHGILPRLRQIIGPLRGIETSLETWNSLHHSSRGPAQDVTRNSGVADLVLLFGELLSGEKVREYRQHTKIKPLSGSKGFFGRDFRRGGEFRITATRLVANACFVVGVKTMTEKNISNILSRASKNGSRISSPSISQTMER